MSKKRNTYRSYVIKSFFKKVNLFNKVNKKSNKDSKSTSPYSNAEQAPMHIALLVDGIVEDIIHCNERLGYLLISEPIVIQLERHDSAKINDIYNEQINAFYSPDEV